MSLRINSAALSIANNVEVLSKVCKETFAHHLEVLHCYWAILRRPETPTRHPQKYGVHGPPPLGPAALLAWLLRVFDFLGCSFNHLPYQSCSISTLSLNIPLISALEIMTGEVHSAIAVINQRAAGDSREPVPLVLASTSSLPG